MSIFAFLHQKFLFSTRKNKKQVSKFNKMLGEKCLVECNAKMYGQVPCVQAFANHLRRNALLTKRKQYLFIKTHSGHLSRLRIDEWKRCRYKD